MFTAADENAAKVRSSPRKKSLGRNGLLPLTIFLVTAVTRIRITGMANALKVWDEEFTRPEYY
jgi:hypothetical protein